MATPTRVAMSKAPGPVRFILIAALIYAVTYFLVGMVASLVLDYAQLLSRPVISDYYLPYGTVNLAVSAASQLLRGALFGAALLPFRGVLAGSRWGWLYVWGIFVIIGILGTPSAAPSSFEGVLYTRLPLWFHLIGLPEMLLQTLAFSVLLHQTLRTRTRPLAPGLQKSMRALAVACIAFLGYTAVSLVFAFSAGAGLASGADARVLGQFMAPLILGFVTALVARGRWWASAHIGLYVTSCIALALYQGVVLGSTGWLYVMVAPILPVSISLFMTRHDRGVVSPTTKE